jgi:hypothetical protein
VIEFFKIVGFGTAKDIRQFLCDVDIRLRLFSPESLVV